MDILSPEILEKLNSTLIYPSLKRRPLSRALGTQTIGTTEVAIAHGINAVPNVVIIQMTSAGNVYQSTPADSTNIYLKADAAGRTANIEVQSINDNIR